MLRPARSSSRPPLVIGVVVAVLAAAGAHAPASVAAPTSGATVRPTAAGGPLPIVWRSGATVFGSALDGSGARELLRVSRVEAALPAPSPDGGRVAFVAGERLLVLDLASGVLRDTGAPASSSSAPRWSPDGARVATVAAGRAVVCELAGTCARWGADVDEEWGMSWSPDSRALALIRSEPRRRGRDGDLVVSTVDRSRTRALDRLRERSNRFSYPSSPVWTANGPTWTLLDLRIEDGELSGIDGVRVRQRRAGRTRTIASPMPTRRTAFPFTVAGEALDDTLLGTTTTFRGMRPTAELRALTTAGRTTGLKVLLPGLDESDRDQLAVLGTLADGRVALVSRRGAARRAELRLATPGVSAGAVVRRAQEIGVATARAGNVSPD